jgi:hypothetical protein
MFRGNYKYRNSSGFESIYAKDDVVLYQGKVYQSLKTTQQSPLQSPQDWKYVSLTEPYKGFEPPINPKENQIWISDSATTYIYFYDGNGYQWIAT